MKDSKKVSNALILDGVEHGLRNGLQAIKLALTDVEFLKNYKVEDLERNPTVMMRRSESYSAALILAALKYGELNRGNFFAYMEGYIGTTEPSISLMAEASEAYLEYNDPSALEELIDKY